MSDLQLDFSGKRFVVVGASSGIGRQIARELAASGADVLAIARNKERLEALEQESEHIQAASLDVLTASTEDWAELLSSDVQAHGKFHGAVYTAGISGATPLRHFDEAFARRIMETSFWGAIRALQVMTKKRISQEGAAFLLFSSVAGHTGEKGLFAYAAAKAAVMAGVKSLAHDLAKDRKRINSISPGYVRTGMTIQSEEDMGTPANVVRGHLFGIGKPQDVAGMVLFLLSDRASWITGEDFIVDGGYMRGAWN
ncbi:SDR family NAD(P)-dependent oxidoreductase [Mitsuokella sp. oral taxon 131]|uniref:SDR family NAD(P)-dependent oxidoreductase n=1 Tax=Mitsuokella sp. oral taxon 131 TaxID=1321780 RepID=UPI0003ADB431|nr:SDR family oxidoreductase [Mitsuokella sp. oral taxon 131]ERL03826.1 oxidoreductase, short chain dehydrogenase/reductase family protein [Mitsuokella sp. oral taxon 131 str. W9106]